ncbi:uncharacterized protein N7503_007627 [Penicillium pulvis]|uniref:uncharacterized protein n=1 Tax=Penicillium pulvis TaxID=1562058 RepID=UPI002546C041|nr:uncharacterized protein N7503_007627 [Penicillium pulvis]KAJ5798331.1 hypothetical protein N7503_007627 [Penicillium pulvis]
MGAYATAQLIGGPSLPPPLLRCRLCGQSLHNSVHNLGASNAVLSAWRDTGVSLILPSVWNSTLPRSVEVQRELQLTNKLEPQLRKLTPGSGG